MCGQFAQNISILHFELKFEFHFVLSASLACAIGYKDINMNSKLQYLIISLQILERERENVRQLFIRDTVGRLCFFLTKVLPQSLPYLA